MHKDTIHTAKMLLPLLLKIKLNIRKKTTSLQSDASLDKPKEHAYHKQSKTSFPFHIKEIIGITNNPCENNDHPKSDGSNWHL
jgi:hypothetical protein